MVGQSGLVPDGDGHTLLSPEDLEHLKLTHITTRGDLNEAEQLNILQAVAETRPPSVGELLDDLYLRRLHRRMFGDVWQWAGRYRMHETNLGADPDLIPAIVKDVVRDVTMWVGEEAEDADTIAVKFHYRLVVVHPFPNGNGRHARLAADYLRSSLGAGELTWGSGRAADAPAVRDAYLQALRVADAQQDFTDLVAFARS